MSTRSSGRQRAFDVTGRIIGTNHPLRASVRAGRAEVTIYGCRFLMSLEQLRALHGFIVSIVDSKVDGERVCPLFQYLSGSRMGASLRAGYVKLELFSEDVVFALEDFRALGDFIGSIVTRWDLEEPKGEGRS